MHLTSRIDEDDLEIDILALKGVTILMVIAVYYNSDLPIIFKPELTKLTKSLIFQVKLGNKKCFFTCTYRNPSIENNSSEKIDEFSTELGNILNNINGKTHMLILLLAT